jgi:hypothetical protein
LEFLAWKAFLFSSTSPYVSGIICGYCRKYTADADFDPAWLWEDIMMNAGWQGMK